MATYTDNPFFMGGMQTTDDLTQAPKQKLDALRTLLGMQSMSNLSSPTFGSPVDGQPLGPEARETSDPLLTGNTPKAQGISSAISGVLADRTNEYKNRRFKEIYSGLDDLAPDANSPEARQLQLQDPGISRADAHSMMFNQTESGIRQATAAHQMKMQELMGPQELKGQQELGLEAARGQSALELEREKGAQARQNFAQMMGGTPQGQPSGTQTPSPGYTGFQETPTAGGLFSWATGIGAPKGSSMMDQALAYKDYQQYMHGGGGPLTDVIENSSLGNLQAIKANFPSIRGIAQLLPLFEQHQPQPGREVPALTDQKLSWMINNMQKMVQDNDPSNPDLQRELRTVSMGPSGPTVSMKATPASLIQGQEALKTTLRQYQAAQTALRARYPGLGGQQQQQEQGGRQIQSVEQIQ